MAKDDNSKEELVTVVCRSMGRPELKLALRSIRSQTYSNIEILLIKAGHIDLSEHASDCSSAPITLIDLGKALSRPEAANAGLEKAKGEFVTFLDEDDWIDKNHIQTLVDALRENPNFKASYCSVQKTDRDGSKKDFTFSYPFDSILLMRDNYIPIHAVVFRRLLLDKGCRFDEKFEIYEDWDFWLQVNQHTNFYHSNTITAFYREGGESETTILDPNDRFSPNTKIGKARAAIFEKWKERWTGAEVNQMIGQLNNALVKSNAKLEESIHQRNLSEHKLSEKRIDLEDIKQKLSEEHKTNLSHQEEIRKLLTKIEAAVHNRNVSDQKSKDLEIQIIEKNDEIQRVLALLTNLRKSWSWRITAPGRFLIKLTRSMLRALVEKKKSDE